MNLNKLEKYFYRFSKSIKKENIFKLNDYASHIKFYIQQGGEEPTKIQERLDLLTQIIETINTNPKLKNITKQLEDKEKELEAAQTEIINLRTELEAALAKISGSESDLQKKITELTTQNTKLTTKLAAANAALKAAQNDNEKKLTEIQTVMIKLADYITGLLSDDEFKGEIPEDLEQKLKDALKLLEEKKKECDALKVRSGDLENTGEKLKEITDRLAVSEASVADLTAQIEALKKQLADLNEEYINFDKTKADDLYAKLDILLTLIFGEDTKKKLLLRSQNVQQVEVVQPAQV
jgi:chromosome segregation ATPase